ncbi:hypothetical protein [Rhizobium sp. RM]|uniref:hypothetical protein n=1 Tax=Rhizobium sp. RM TaxID=2748079 RepID=UPI00110F6233|nr:hypothetical protein [Rhizobium sp. RM]NWJ26154.1 hypothetical protein [Rhizobium sp. RM]TMV20746.1 hypothetical protein BJG94_08615 [Rhizobium sp. Td3]
MDTQPDRETQGKENHRRDAVSPDIDMQSGDEKPDVFSKTARLGQAYSEATGHPAPPHSIIMGNEAEFQRTIDTIRRAKLLKEHPRLAAWLAENRTNGESAERDLENLATFDRIAKDATEREKDRRNSVFYQPAAPGKTDTGERATGQPNSLMYQTAGPTAQQSRSPFTPVTTPVAGSNTDGDVGRTANPAVSVTPPGPAPSAPVAPTSIANETENQIDAATDQTTAPLTQQPPASSEPVTQPAGAGEQKQTTQPARDEALQQASSSVAPVDPIESPDVVDNREGPPPPPKESADGFLEATGNTYIRATEGIAAHYNYHMFNHTARRHKDRQLSFGDILDSERIKTPDGENVFFITPPEIFFAAARYIDAKYANLTDTDDYASSLEFAEALAKNHERIKSAKKSALATGAEKTMFVEGATLGNTLQNFGHTMMNNPLGFLAWSAETLGENAPKMALMAGAAAVARNPNMLLAVEFGTSYAIESNKASVDFFKEKKLDFSNPEHVQRMLSDPYLMKEANERGVTRGLVIAAFDTATAGLGNKIDLDNHMVQALAENMTDAIGSASGEYFARLASGQKADWNEILKDSVSKSALVPASLGKAGYKTLSDFRSASKAKVARTQAEEMSSAAQSSAIRNQAPETYRDHISRITAGTPIENQLVPAKAFTDHLKAKGIDPYGYLDGFGINRADLDTALTTGGDLKIPAGIYATKIAGSQHDAFVKDNMRFDPSTPTFTEAGNLEARRDEFIVKAFGDDAVRRKRAEADLAAEHRIAADVQSRLLNHGASPDTVMKQSVAYPAFYAALAGRNGMTTHAFLQRFPLPQQPASSHRKIMQNGETASVEPTLTRGEIRSPTSGPTFTFKNAKPFSEAFPQSHNSFVGQNSRIRGVIHNQPAKNSRKP